MHKSGKTFELLHFRKTGRNTAEVTVLVTVAISNIYYGDVSQAGRRSGPAALRSAQQTLHPGTG